MKTWYIVTLAVTRGKDLIYCNSGDSLYGTDGWLWPGYYPYPTPFARHCALCSKLIGTQCSNKLTLCFDQSEFCSDGWELYSACRHCALFDRSCFYCIWHRALTGWQCVLILRLSALIGQNCGTEFLFTGMLFCVVYSLCPFCLTLYSDWIALSFDLPAQCTDWWDQYSDWSAHCDRIRQMMLWLVGPVLWYVGTVIGFAGLVLWFGGGGGCTTTNYGWLTTTSSPSQSQHEFTLLEKIWQISVYATDYAIAYSLFDVEFSLIEGNGWKFCHVELGNSASVKMF